MYYIDFWGVFEPGVRNLEFRIQGSGTPNLEFGAWNPGFEHRSSLRTPDSNFKLNSKLNSTPNFLNRS